MTAQLFHVILITKELLMIWRFRKHKKATEMSGYAETAYLTSVSLILLLFIAARGYINARQGTNEVRKTN